MLKRTEDNQYFWNVFRAMRPSVSSITIQPPRKWGEAGQKPSSERIIVWRNPLTGADGELKAPPSEHKVRKLCKSSINCLWHQLKWKVLSSQQIKRFFNGRLIIKIYISFGGHQTQTICVQIFIWYVSMYINNLLRKRAWEALFSNAPF